MRIFRLEPLENARAIGKIRRMLGALRPGKSRFSVDKDVGG